jgi:hypothetical protein
MKATCAQCNQAFESNDPVGLAAMIGEHMQAHLDQQKPPPPLPPQREGEPPLSPQPEPPGEWQERSAQFTIFDEEGQEIVGMLTGFDTIRIHDKEIRRARIKTADGTHSFLLTTQLEPLLLDLPDNTTVRIRYEGEVKSAAGRRVKKFRVWTMKGAP